MPYLLFVWWGIEWMKYLWKWYNSHVLFQWLINSVCDTWLIWKNTLTMHVTYALIKAYDGTLTFQHCLRNLQQYQCIHASWFCGCCTKHLAPLYIWKPDSFDRILLAICRNNKGEGERGWGWFNNIVQWTWIFCFGPRYVDALSPQFHVPVVFLSPPVRIHTYEQPVISAETVYCLTFARALFYVLTGNRRIAGFIKWFVMRMSLLTSQRYVGGIFC